MINRQTKAKLNISVRIYEIAKHFVGQIKNKVCHCRQKMIKQGAKNHLFGLSLYFMNEIAFYSYSADSLVQLKIL